MGLVRAIVMFVLLAFVGLGSAAQAQDELPPGPFMHAVKGDPDPVPGRVVHVPVGWNTVMGDRVRLHAPARHDGLAEALVLHADEALPSISERLHLPVGAPIDIFLSTTDDQFRRVQPGVPPSWAEATAYPSLGAVYLRAPGARRGDPEPLTTVLDHELVHIVVGRAFAPERPPTWLQEGLAQLHAEQHDLASIKRLSAAAFSGPIPLDELEGAFPKNPHAASLAYAESVDFLVWLETTYGPRAVPTLVYHLQQGQDLPAAVLATTGQPLYAVNEAWTSRFTGSSALIWTALQSWDGVWLLTALIGTMAMFVVRRRQRVRRNAIKAREVEEEALLQAIWEGRFPVGPTPQRARSAGPTLSPSWLLVAPSQPDAR